MTATTTSRPALSRRRKLAYALLACLLLLAVLEGGARGYAALRRAIAGPDPAEFSAVVTRFVPDPFRAFRLNPDHPDHTRQGFRGRDEYRLDHRGLRIVCMGGSATYGSTVAETECYPRQLGNLLAGAGGPPVEVINAGVSGYSTPQVLAHLALTVAGYEPDVVFFYLGFNDATVRLAYRDYRSDYTHALRSWSEASGPWWRHSRLLDGLAGILGQPAPPRYLHDFCFFPARTAERNWAASDPAAFARNLVSLAAVCRAHGILPVFAAEAPDPGQLTDNKELIGRALDETAAVLSATVQQLGADAIDLGASLRGRSELFADVIHLNPAGNRECARLIAEALRAKGILARTPRQR